MNIGDEVDLNDLKQGVKCPNVLPSSSSNFPLEDNLGGKGFMWIFSVD